MLVGETTSRAGAHLVTNFYVEKAGKQPPNPVDLLYPTDYLTVFTFTFFAWNRTTDPDSAAPESTTTRTFTTDNANPDVPGALPGAVTAGDTATGVPGVTLTLKQRTWQCVSGTAGEYFLGGIVQGNYTLTITRPGFVKVEHTGITISSDRYTQLDVILERSGDDVPHPADTDMNFRLVMSEAIAYLAGWQQGTNSMAYAIRAAYLWQNGEAYTYDSETSPPLCWVLLQ